MTPKNFAPAWRCLLLLGAAWVAGCGRPAAPADTSAGTAAPGSQPLQKVTLLLDWYPSAEHGGLYEALVKNYYRDAGLDVTIAPGGPASFPLQMIGTGRAPFALGRCDDVILAARQGLPLVIVCAQMEHDPQAVMVHADSPVRTLRDLDGRSVMAGPAANWVAYVQAHYGIKFQVIPTDWGIGRFIADKDFIQQCFISNEPYYAEANGVKTRAILVAGGGYDPYRVIFTSRSYAQAHPDVVRGFVAATIRGYTEFLHGDAAQARARIQSENPSQTPALIDYSISAMKEYKVVEGDPAKGERTGLVTPERMNAMQETLVELKILDAPMPLDRFASFDFLPPGPAPAPR